MTARFRTFAQLVVSALIIIPFWALVFLLFFYGGEIHASVKPLLDTILSQIIPVFVGVFGFWMGTSLSSAAKDQKPTNPENPPNA